MSNTSIEKPYLISIASWTPGVDDYLKSLPKLQNSVEWINVELKEYPGHLQKFDYVPFEDLDDRRMIIYTDTQDVTFQAPIPELKEGLYITPEGRNWTKEGFYGEILMKNKFNDLWDRPVYNSGSWAMPVWKFKEMLRFFIRSDPKIEQLQYKNPFNQPLYNYWLSTQEFMVHPSLMTCLYDNYGAGNVCLTPVGFVNRNDELYSIVHANGDSKNLLINFQK
jgi:hypothetical protein